MICQSIYHWARECPEKKDKRDQYEEVKITLLTSELHRCYIQEFLGETLNCAVLDSGCSKTVCAVAWLECYLETLNNEELEEVTEEESCSSFKFGDGKVM